MPSASRRITATSRSSAASPSAAGSVSNGPATTHLAVVLDDQAAGDLGAAAAFGDVDDGRAAVTERLVGRPVGVEAGHGEHVVVALGGEPEA